MLEKGIDSFCQLIAENWKCIREKDCKTCKDQNYYSKCNEEECDPKFVSLITIY